MNNEERNKYGFYGDSIQQECSQKDNQWLQDPKLTIENLYVPVNRTNHAILSEEYSKTDIAKNAYELVILEKQTNLLGQTIINEMRKMANHSEQQVEECRAKIAQLMQKNNQSNNFGPSK